MILYLQENKNKRIFEKVSMAHLLADSMYSSTYLQGLPIIKQVETASMVRQQGSR